MDKSFVRIISSEIKNIKNDMSYIDNVKYVIFIISKFLYLDKLCGHELLEEDYDSTVSKNVLSCDGMGIFETYNKFDLCTVGEGLVPSRSDQSIERNIYCTIQRFKDILRSHEFVPAELYESLLTLKEKKSLGQVYTPGDIIDKMLYKAFRLKKIDKSTKLLDPSCGGGYFLIEAFKKIKEILKEDHLDDRYILENMLYGIDVDEFSIFLTKVGLLFHSSCTNINFNIVNIDYLDNSYDFNVLYDIIIGNPPYIGHKQTDKDYRELLNERYSDVFYDKADISYCFFKRSGELLNNNGIISFISSRYFMEAMYADKLRKFLKNSFSIISIEDYSGLKVFKDAMVSPAIITLSNSTKNKNAVRYVKYNKILSKCDSFDYEQNKLKDSGWVMLRDEEEELFTRIENVSNAVISEICTIKQGIITGLDEAFVVTGEEAEKYKLENVLLKKWIKNSNISRDNISFNGKYLLYTNMIEDERECPNVIKYLLPYKERLMKRRECQSGSRKWYELQWGRNTDDFENPKILFPYKSKGSNFYLDTDNYYCSADVYFINNLRNGVTFEYLKSWLNSGIFDFYFKCQAKKVGVDLFEYYPNKLNNMKLNIPESFVNQKTFDSSNFGIENYFKKVFNINEKEEITIISKFNKKGDDAN